MIEDEKISTVLLLFAHSSSTIHPLDKATRNYVKIMQGYPIVVICPVFGHFDVITADGGEESNVFSEDAAHRYEKPLNMCFNEIAPLTWFHTRFVHLFLVPGFKAQQPVRYIRAELHLNFGCFELLLLL